MPQIVRTNTPMKIMTLPSPQYKIGKPAKPPPSYVAALRKGAAKNIAKDRAFLNRAGVGANKIF